MTKITVTEALAEVPTIEKRIEKKRQFILDYLYRQSVARDPHEKSGGSNTAIKEQMQSIKDLQERLIHIRAEIQKSNQETTITVGEQTRTISDWLTWRREVSAGERYFYNNVSNKLQTVRNEAMRRGVTVTDKDAGATQDYIINVDEKEIAEMSEKLEEILGTLDGQLSLKNATTFIEV